jgi:diaminopimelate epimerase
VNLAFTKMHGIGNDFVVVDCLVAGAPSASALQEASPRLCDRRLGVGSDGVLLVLPSRVANYKMRMFNPDGSEAEMCGNGIRCFAKFVYDRGHTADTQITVETLGGTKTLKMTARGGRVESVKVDMGCPSLERGDLPMRGEPGDVVAEAIKADGKKFEITGVSMGNPHAVLFTDSTDAFPIERVGPAIENHTLFPKRINVHAVQVLNSDEVRMVTWERGAGRTAACGTGACAVAVASAVNKKTGRRVLAHLPGGDLVIEWTGDNRVLMTGPAEESFTGHITL